MGGIRNSAQQVSVAVADVRDNLQDRTKLIVGLLAASVLLLTGILCTLLAGRAS